MRFGVEFVNTSGGYDALFHRGCRERNLIPAEVPVNKSDVRNYLRRIGHEDAWTEMQGYVYGARMNEAEAYPGVLDFFRAARAGASELCIISHKTKHPFRGPAYDLHQAALGWLELNGFFDPARIGLPRESAFLELTKQEKLARIAERGCTHFIDDLPELLMDPGFPNGVKRVLFDPNNLYPDDEAYLRVKSWIEARAALLVNAPEPAPVTDEALEILAPFLKEHGFDDAARITPVRGGANNRVYRVEGGGKVKPVKQYFRHAADARDRFGAERAFYQYAWTNGIRRTPEPLAWCEVRRIGLFSFADGRKLTPPEVDRPRGRTGARICHGVEPFPRDGIGGHPAHGLGGLLFGSGTSGVRRAANGSACAGSRQPRIWTVRRKSSSTKASIRPGVRSVRGWPMVHPELGWIPTEFWYPSNDACRPRISDFTMRCATMEERFHFSISSMRAGTTRRNSPPIFSASRNCRWIGGIGRSL